MTFILLKLIVGIVVLLLSTRGLVRLSQKLAKHFKISPLVLGITLVALGTSLPELAVSGIAAVKGDSGLALGNIVGSNISNIFLVFPVGILFGRMRIGTTKTQRNIAILMAITFLFFVLHLFPINHYFVGAILLVITVGLTIMEYRWAVRGRDHEDASKISHDTVPSFTRIDALLLLNSLASIIAGGYLTVSATEGLSALTGYSTTTLGLSLTAVATSLPELLTTIFAQEEHQEKLTMGNVIGSNLYNLALIGGFTNLVTIPESLTSFSWMVFVTSAGIIFVIVKYYSGNKVPRWIAGSLLLCLLGYLYFL